MSRTRTLFLASLVLPFTLRAQSAPSQAPTMLRNDAWRVTLTIFRSPGTGVMVGKGMFAAFVGHYPTAIPFNGEVKNLNFVRYGVTAYASPASRTSAYLSLSAASSLTKGWANSAMVDVGVRRMFTPRFSGQLGAAVLHAPSTNATRFNPTVGFGVHF